MSWSRELLRRVALSFLGALLRLLSDRLRAGAPLADDAPDRSPDDAAAHPDQTCRMSRCQNNDPDSPPSSDASSDARR